MKLGHQKREISQEEIENGLASVKEIIKEIDEIIKKSDIALYEARNRGRSQVFMFSEEDTNKIDFF